MTKARTAFGIAILLAVLLPLTLLAQTEAPPAQGQDMGEHHARMGRMGGPPSPQARLDHLSRMLNLTDDQKARIKPFLESQATQVQSLRQETSLSPQDRHAKMRGLHESTMRQIRSVLTPDQQAKLDQMKQKHEGMGHGKGMGQGMGMGQGQQQAPPPPPQ